MQGLVPGRALHEAVPKVATDDTSKDDVVLGEAAEVTIEDLHAVHETNMRSDVRRQPAPTTVGFASYTFEEGWSTDAY